MRRGLFLVVLAAGCTPDGPPYFIPGSATLPDCQEAPQTDLSGAWYDNGDVEITSNGCEDTMEGDRLMMCGLDWQVTQNGNDVSIEVDDEYRIEGRLCGDQLHLEGGWWISVDLEGTGCTYEDGIEVGIEAEGATLAVQDDGTVAGVLEIRAGCTARYDMVLRRKRARSVEQQVFGLPGSVPTHERVGTRTGMSNRRSLDVRPRRSFAALRQVRVSVAPCTRARPHGERREEGQHR